MSARLFTPPVVRQACSRSITYSEHLYNLLSRVETCVLGILIATKTPPPLYYCMDVFAFARARYSHMPHISVPYLLHRYEERRKFHGFAPGWRRREAENRGEEGTWRILRVWGEGGERVRNITEMLQDGRRVVDEIEEALGVPEGEREAHALFCVTWGRSRGNLNKCSSQMGMGVNMDMACPMMGKETKFDYVKNRNQTSPSAEQFEQGTTQHSRSASTDRQH